MARRSYALRLFASGEALAVADVARLAEVPRAKAADDVSSLKRRGLIALHATGRGKTSYVITQSGIEHLRRTDVEGETSRILRAYSCGEPLTAFEVSLLTGSDPKRIRNVAGRLKGRGHLETVSEAGSRKVRMRLTEAGKQEIAGQDVAPPALNADTTVKLALRGRPALETAWGAFA